MRPAPVFLSLFLATTISAANLKMTVVPPAAPDPDNPVQWRVTLENVSGGTLPETVMYPQFAPGRIISIEPDFKCEVVNFSWRCTLKSLAPGEIVELTARVQFPFRYGRVAGGVAISYAPGVSDTDREVFTYWRDFPVTTAAETGPGSLRLAILRMNATTECHHRPDAWIDPCRVAFRIDEAVPENRWHTIQLQTPLPAVIGYDVAIDGSTQRDSNPFGPDVFLDGSALTAGNGITFESDTTWHAAVSNLAIGGFPWNGVSATSNWFLWIEDCYIGVDPTGGRAVPNGSRGVDARVFSARLSRNVLSGNRRSGVFVTAARQSQGPHIRDNRIGVAAHDATPIPNGASGIFVGDFNSAYSKPVIEGNVIANNAEFGVALTPNAQLPVLVNSIYDNGMGGIDIGLDGPTESRPGIPAIEGGVVSPPVITSARYANGVTTITGYSLAGDRRQVLLYANSTLDPGGYAEGQQFLGTPSAQLQRDTAFTFEFPGDLRGKYVNGTSYAVTDWAGWEEHSYTSSEFGRALRVE